MTRLRFSATGILFAALLVAFPAVSRADNVNENFDELPTLLNATNLGAFSVTSGTVDVVGGALYGSLCGAPPARYSGDRQGRIPCASPWRR